MGCQGKMLRPPVRSLSIGRQSDFPGNDCRKLTGRLGPSRVFVNPALEPDCSPSQRPARDCP